MVVEVTEVSTSSYSRMYYDLAGAPLVSFGQAGMLSPHRAKVERESHHNQTGDRTASSVKISLKARNRNNVEFRGTWGWPDAARPLGWEHDYGHYGWGFISELPEELRHELGVFE